MDAFHAVIIEFFFRITTQVSREKAVLKNVIKLTRKFH